MGLVLIIIKLLTLKLIVRCKVNSYQQFYEGLNGVNQ